MGRQSLRSGFGFVELLVVVAVVAILAALLLPALSGAKAQANSIKCRSNLRQLGIQMQMYVNDFGAYPGTGYVYEFFVGTGVYFELDLDGVSEKRNLGDHPIRKCPTYNKAGVNPDAGFGPAKSYGYNNWGYIGINGPDSREGHYGLAGRTVNGLAVHVKEGEVRVPSDMIELGDSFALLPKDGHNFSEDRVMEYELGLVRQELLWNRSPGVDELVNRADTRHRKQGNVVFCDGHVEMVKFRRLFLDRGDASLRRWNKDNEAHR